MNEYIFTSERLGFALWKEDDLELARSLWGDPEVTRFISANGRFNEDQIKNRLALEIRNQERYGVQYWKIYDLETGEFAGCCGLRPHGPLGEFEIGCHLKKDFWGRGLALEGSKRVIAYAFEEVGALSVFAGHNPANEKSAKIAAKLGLRRIKDEYYPPTGLMHPSYRMTKKEFLSNK